MRSLILLCLLITSCNATKRVNKKEVDTTQTEEIVRQTTRKGDTVTFFVPKIILKDTTIYTVNRVGTRIETRYNDKGEIDRVDCYTSAIEELTQINRELITAISEKDKEEEFKIPTAFFIMLGVVLIVFFGILIFYVHTQIGPLKKLLP